VQEERTDSSIGPRPPGEAILWRRLGPRDVFALALAVGLILWIGVPRLPPGVCVADAGDLQLAARVLGIPHPPGYAGYVSLAHLATLIPGVDPAYAVSLLCLGLGVFALLLAALIAIRLGVHPFVAAATSLALSAHTRVWQNLVTPELYVFSIAFSLGATYLMLRYLALGRSRDLLAAAFLLGIAIANRPPLLVLAPFFLWSWWRSSWRPRGSGSRVARQLLSLVAAASLPGVYSLAYFYARDNPATAYNYLDQHNDEARELPESTDGVAAKVRRVMWLATGEQFRDHFGNNWKRMRTKLRWLRYETIGREIPTAFGFLVLAATGAWTLLNRHRTAGWVVFAGGAQAFVYRLMYRDDGQAADMLPLLMCMGILASVGVSRVIAPGRGRWGEALGLAVLGATVAYTLRDAPDRPNYASNVDASDFLAQTHLESLPRDAVILTFWTHAPPLLYAQIVNTERPDISIVAAQIVNWRRMADQYAPRPIFVTTPSPIIPSSELTPEGNLFRVAPPLARTPEA